jgi:lactate dehydrogenase-like 2-hydroxyacid dehydrogenase
MTEPTIPVIALGHQHPRLIAGLKERFVVHELPADADPAALSDAVRQARGLTSFGTVGASNAMLDALPGLEILSLCSVGYDKVDVEHCRARDIRVTNTPDVLTDDTADLGVALLYATFRNIAANDLFVRSGQWAQGKKPPLARKLTGRRIGILGLGRIGRAIARRLEAVAGEILYHGRHEQADAPYRFVADRIDFARECEVIVVATAGGAGTAGLVDAAMLDALGPDGVIVNIARGSVIDEGALVTALAEKRIRAAGLDVFVAEPQVPAGLLAMDNVVLQPHQGSATEETRLAMAELVLANLDAHFAGDPLPTAVV